MNLPKPYLVFLGDASDYKQAKVACGLVEWRPELCVGKHSLPGCALTLDIPELTLEQAVDVGAKTFVIGISPFTTKLPDDYIETIHHAIRLGMNIANPLHADLPEELVRMAKEHGVEVFNFRHRSIDYPKATGEKRQGLRLLTVGTDCACGKKYTAVSIHRALQKAGGKSTFRSTGQTGFLISESGINNDTIQADFLSGAAEWLTPENDADHWDVVEGQGALSHPSFGAGSLSLLHGTQPDLLVMCHEPGRKSQRGVRKSLPYIGDEINLALTVARRNNPNVKLGAISVFTGNREDAGAHITFLRRQFNVPVFDPSHARQSLSADGEAVDDVAGSAKDFAKLINAMLSMAGDTNA